MTFRLTNFGTLADDALNDIERRSRFFENQFLSGFRAPNEALNYIVDDEQKTQDLDFLRRNRQRILTQREKELEFGIKSTQANLDDFDRSDRLRDLQREDAIDSFESGYNKKLRDLELLDKENEITKKLTENSYNEVLAQVTINKSKDVMGYYGELYNIIDNYEGTEQIRQRLQIKADGELAKSMSKFINDFEKVRFYESLIRNSGGFNAISDKEKANVQVLYDKLERNFDFIKLAIEKEVLTEEDLPETIATLIFGTSDTAKSLKSNDNPTPSAPNKPVINQDPSGENEILDIPSSTGLNQPLPEEQFKNSEERLFENPQNTPPEPVPELEQIEQERDLRQQEQIILSIENYLKVPVFTSEPSTRQEVIDFMIALDKLAGEVTGTELDGLIENRLKTLVELYNSGRNN